MWRFDGIINFGLWKVQVTDVLIQVGLHKPLEGRQDTSASKDLRDDASPGEPNDDSSKGSMIFIMRDEEREEMDLRATSVIILNLAKNVLANVHRISTAKDL